MRSLSLWYLIMRLWLAGVNDVREAHGILDEKDRNIISNDVPVALVGVELDCKAAYITNRIRTPTASKNGGKPKKYRRFSTSFCQNTRRCHVCSALMQPEGTKSTSSASMYHSLGDSFMIEAMYLLLVKSEISLEGPIAI